MGGWRVCRAMAAIPPFHTRIMPLAASQIRYCPSIFQRKLQLLQVQRKSKAWVSSVAAPGGTDLVLREILDAGDCSEESCSEDDDGVYDVESEYETEEVCMDGVDVSAALQLANEISNLKDTQLDLVVPEVKRWIRVGNPVMKNNFLFVISKLRSRKLYAHAVKIANWMEDRKPVPYETRDEIRRMELYSHCGSNYRAEKIFNRLAEVERSERAYNAMLLAFTKRKMRGKSESVYEKLKAKQLITSSYAFNLMAGLYQSKGVEEKVLELEKEAKECGVQLDVCFKNILISAKHKAEGIQAAANLFQDIKHSTKGFLVTTYVAMAECYASEQQFEQAKHVLQEIEQELNSGGFPKRRSAYNLLITMYSKIKHPAGVKRVWEKLVGHVGTPVTRDFTTVIMSWGNLGQVEMSQRLFNEAESCGKLSSSKIFTAMFYVYAKLDLLPEAQALEKRMIEDLGVKLDPHAYYHLQELYLNKGMIEEAVNVLRKSEQAGTKRKKWKPLGSSLTLVLGAVAAIPDTEMAKNLMGEWKAAGYELTAAHYNQLLVGYMNAGEPVDGFVDRMLMDDVRPNSKTQELFEEIKLRKQRVP